MQHVTIPRATAEPVPERIAEARYAYYRRCQVFCKGGEQCKAPAEKGSEICHAHAGQLAMAVRRERERRAVLEEAVAQMRRRGRPECEMADLFMDFKGINMTLAVMAQAVIAGRIDCKTAGRLVVQLQTASKLLRMLQRTKTKTSPWINTDNTDLKNTAEESSLTMESPCHGAQLKAKKQWVATECEQTRIALVTEVRTFAEKCSWSHAPPELLRAA
jgi:hypothetical protein